MKILTRPVITEKSMQYADSGVYTFEVNSAANKNQIKNEVEQQFGVKVVAVRSGKIHTADKKTGPKRISNSYKRRKFARVTLKSGDKISLFDLKEESKGGK